MRSLRGAIADAGRALSFLTVLPVRAGGPAGDAAPGRAAAWFPAVGALVGGVAGAVRLGGEQLVGSLAATVLALVALVALTGALHQDGLADVADALGARGGRRRRLEIMRDPANGTFGTLALICWALLIVAAVAGLPASRALRTLVVACAIGRAAALGHARLIAPARQDGLGAAFMPSLAAVVVGCASAAGVAVLLCGPWRAAVAVTLSAAAVAGLTIASRRLFGGRTGDTLGASVALCEAVVCLALASVWR
jgi:adenosylcobinamide-GDP ribazoletransferase